MIKFRVEFLCDLWLLESVSLEVRIPNIGGWIGTRTRRRILADICTTHLSVRHTVENATNESIQVTGHDANQKETLINYFGEKSQTRRPLMWIHWVDHCVRSKAQCYATHSLKTDALGRLCSHESHASVSSLDCEQYRHFGFWFPSALARFADCLFQ